MPNLSLDVGDAAELAEILLFLCGWLAVEHGGLGASQQRYVGRPACGITELRADLDRFTFLLDGSVGELLFQSSQWLGSSRQAASPRLSAPARQHPRGQTWADLTDELAWARRVQDLNTAAVLPDSRADRRGGLPGRTWSPGPSARDAGSTGRKSTYLAPACPVRVRPR